MDNNDDWLYDSIKSTLNMYDLQMRPQHLAQIDPERLCLAGKHPSSDKTEILRIRIPSKLFMPQKERGRCKHNDFEIDSGGFVENAVIQGFRALNEENVVALMENDSGLTIYHLDDLRPEKILSGVSCSNFAVNVLKEEILVISDLETIVFDVASQEMTKFQRPANFSSHLDCEFLNSNVLAFIDKSAGSIWTYDRRDEREMIIEKPTTGKNFVFAVDDSRNRLVSADKRGHVFVYDSRYPASPVIHEKIELGDSTSDKMKIRLQSDKFSISGHDSTVSVFAFKGNTFIEEFKHFGHCDECSSKVTDHLWLPQLSDRFLLSCADNGSLNCWEYIPKIDN